MMTICEKTHPLTPYCVNPKLKKAKGEHYDRYICKLSPDTCGFAQSSQQAYEAMPGRVAFEEALAHRKEEKKKGVEK